jgi:hypothetical protein
MWQLLLLLPSFLWTKTNFNLSLLVNVNQLNSQSVWANAQLADLSAAVWHLWWCIWVLLPLSPSFLSTIWLLSFFQNIVSTLIANEQINIVCATQLVDMFAAVWHLGWCTSTSDYYCCWHLLSYQKFGFFPSFKILYLIALWIETSQIHSVF